MANIYAGSANYVPLATTKVIHAKPGKLRGIIAGGDGSGTITFYDNTAGTGTILLVIDVVTNYNQLSYIEFPLFTPLVFAVGLTIITSTHARCFVITEA